MTRLFAPGETAIVRFMGRVSGVGGGFPVRVIEDGSDRTVLYLAAGTKYRRATWIDDPELPGRDLPNEFNDAVWARHDVLRIMYPNVPYSVWAMWRAGTSDFAGWYVNIEEPFARSVVGFDITDYELDIVVAPDLTWRWKDEREFERLERVGVFSAARANEIRQMGLDAVCRMENREPPFNEPWPGWRPDPGWEPPPMPEDSSWLV